MAADQPLLSIRDLTVAYQTRRGLLPAIHQVSFDVPRGAAVGLVGESGSGKSTIGASILNLLGPGGVITGGEIRFRGDDLLKKSPDEMRALRGNQISIVFQDPLTSLTPSLTIGEQIAEPLMHHRRQSKRAAWARAVELLDLVGIPDPQTRAKQYPHEFSGGMRQRVAIAIALSCEPDLVVLDEPTTALDVTIQAQVLELLDRLRSELHLSMLLITHDLGVVAQICDSVCVLYGGRLVETASVADIFQRPGHPYTKGLLSCLPDLSSTARHRLPHIPGRVHPLDSPPSGCTFHPRCPFQEERCRTEEQPLVHHAPGQAVACWKAAQLTDVAWPVNATERAAATAEQAGPRLTIADLHKEYRLTGLWGSIKLVRDSDRLPRVAFEPKTLRAVDGVSLTLQPGETVGLVGESGSGKSTLGRLLVGLIHPTTGEVLLDGHSVSGMSREERLRYRKNVQIIFQNPESSLNPRKTVGEILARPVQFYGLARGQSVEGRVADLLEQVQLSPTYANRFPHQLSGGEKQRVGIARALAAEPKFIVCDEPISALDVSVRASILNLLDDLKQEYGLSYLFIAHDLAVVKHISDRIAVMYRGRLCEVGTVEEIFAPPYHPYTWSLLSAIPIPEYSPEKRKRVQLQGAASAAQHAGPGCVFADRCPVKLGAVCDTTPPPDIAVTPGHVIRCHQPVAFLRGLDPRTAAHSGHGAS